MYLNIPNTAQIHEFTEEIFNFQATCFKVCDLLDKVETIFTHLLVNLLFINLFIIYLFVFLNFHYMFY